MEPVKDIIFDNDDIVIENGDFKVTESDAYHIKDIFEAEKGQYYNEPLIGVGIGKYEKSSGKEIELKREIRINLESDNYKVDILEVEIDNDELIVETENTVRIK